MNNPFLFFDKVYCINLKEREDRWQESYNNFIKYEITNWERFDAIKINDNLNNKRKGQIGCALSFCSLINEAIQKGEEKILIFEDDFEFKKNKEELHEKLNHVINDLPPSWDSLFLGGTLINDYGWIPIQKYSNHLYKLNSAHCMHAVAFSKKGLNKIKGLFKNNHNWHYDLIKNYEAIDIFFAKDYQHQTESFISNEILCYQRVNLSSIENATYDYSEWMNRNFKYFQTFL